LSLLVPALRKTTLVRRYFGEWIVKNIDLWFASTRRLALRITRMEDIVFVTGSHLAGYFLCEMAIPTRHLRGGISCRPEWPRPSTVPKSLRRSNTIESSSTQGSVHIHQRVSCDTGSGNTAKASRRSQANSESR